MTQYYRVNGYEMFQCTTDKPMDQPLTEGQLMGLKYRLKVWDMKVLEMKAAKYRLDKFVAERRAERDNTQMSRDMDELMHPLID